MNLMYVRKSSFLGDSHKENAPMINHTLGKKNIVAYALSWITNYGNQKTIHEFNYTMETMSEIYDTGELSEGISYTGIKGNNPG